MSSTLDEVWKVLKWHSKNKTCIETINRLWQKNQKMWGTSNAPTFHEEELSVYREQWEPERLWNLLHNSQVTELNPASLDHEIVALRFGTKTFILDGRRRINHWKRACATQAVDVLVIVPKR